MPWYEIDPEVKSMTRPQLAAEVLQDVPFHVLMKAVVDKRLRKTGQAFGPCGMIASELVRLVHLNEAVLSMHQVRPPEIQDYIREAIFWRTVHANRVKRTREKANHRPKPRRLKRYSPSVWVPPPVTRSRNRPHRRPKTPARP